SKHVGPVSGYDQYIEEHLVKRHTSGLDEYGSPLVEGKPKRTTSGKGVGEAAGERLYRAFLERQGRGTEPG
ncbi:hypothetical protein KIPB_016970, partial [Kipferlia bialata]